VKLRVAAARYAIGAPADFATFADRVGGRVAAAARAGAQCVVLPEYLALEAAAMQPMQVRSDFVRSLHALLAIRDDYLALARELAMRHSIHLVAGTFLAEVGAGRFRNRAWFAAPGGGVAFQDKLTLTGFERASGVIEPGDALKVFDSDLGRIAIDVCYDIEFPLYARAQAEAGARLLLVPSCTDTLAGANRGFPEDGIAALAQPGADWVHADIDLDALERLRHDGQVANRTDWLRQQRAVLARARVERL
jgi:predicted amidohydrolase